MSDLRETNIHTIISSEKDLPIKLQEFYSQLNLGCVILLKGEVGAGKTALVSAYFESRNKNKTKLEGSNFSSPSYNIINEYIVSGIKIYHIDLYRLADNSDFESTGFWDVISDDESVVFVEWPYEELKREIKKRTVYLVTIEGLDDDQRSYKIEKL